MKKTIEISVHLLFWILFIATVFILAKIYLEAKPDATFSGYFPYVIFLEIFMGVIFFYTAYFCMPWALKKRSNAYILAAILLFLLLFFAFPAMKFGILQIMSSIIPHVFLIFLATIFRLYSDSVGLNAE